MSLASVHVATLLGTPILDARILGQEQARRLRDAIRAAAQPCVALDFEGIQPASSRSFAVAVLPTLRTAGEPRPYVVLANLGQDTVEQVDRALRDEGGAVWHGTLRSEGFVSPRPLGVFDLHMHAILLHAATTAAPFCASDARVATPLRKPALDGRLAKLHERGVLHRGADGARFRYCVPWKLTEADVASEAIDVARDEDTESSLERLPELSCVKVQPVVGWRTPRVGPRLPGIETAHRRHLPMGFSAMEGLLGGLALGELCMVASTDPLAASEVCRTIARATYDGGFQVVHDAGVWPPGPRERDYIQVHIAGAPIEEVFCRVLEGRRAEPGARLVVLEGMDRMKGCADRNIETLKRFLRDEELAAVVSMDELPFAPSHPSDLYLTISPVGEEAFREVRVLHPRRDVVFTFPLPAVAVPAG